MSRLTKVLFDFKVSHRPARGLSAVFPAPNIHFYQVLGGAHITLTNKWRSGCIPTVFMLDLQNVIADGFCNFKNGSLYWKDGQI